MVCSSSERATVASSSATAAEVTSTEVTSGSNFTGEGATKVAPTVVEITAGSVEAGAGVPTVSEVHIAGAGSRVYHVHSVVMVSRRGAITIERNDRLMKN